MTVVSALSPISLTQFFYASGKIVRPARLFFYKPQTEDLVVVFTEPTLGVPHEQPVLSGGSGRVPPIYVGTEPYRVRAYDSYGSLIEDIPYLPGAVTPGDTEVAEPAAGVYLRTGDMFFAFAAAATQRPGSVRANGGLIGRTGCVHGTPDIIERYNDDTYNLFTWLWGQDDVLVQALGMLPSRGGSSAADWADGKAMALPDLRGRALVGIDGMGVTLTHRLDQVQMTPASVTAWSGVTGGVATMTQTLAQMPTHNHPLSPGYADIGISVNTTGVYISDPTHAHHYWGVIPERAAAQEEPLSLVPAEGPVGPSALVSDILTGYSVTGNYIVDGGHTHGLTQNAHTHALTGAGGGTPMQTITPFSLATVYIKL